MLKKILGYISLGIIAFIVVFASIMAINETVRYYDNDTGAYLNMEVTNNGIQTYTFDKEGYMLVSQSVWDTNIKVSDTLTGEDKTHDEKRVEIYKMDRKVGEVEVISKSAWTKRYLKYLEMQTEVIEAERDEEIRHLNAVYDAIDTPSAIETATLASDIQTQKDNAERDVVANELSIEETKTKKANTKHNAVQAGWMEFGKYFGLSYFGLVVFGLGFVAYVFLKKEEEGKKSAK